MTIGNRKMSVGLISLPLLCFSIHGLDLPACYKSELTYESVILLEIWKDILGR
jgi:hypothetical protein